LFLASFVQLFCRLVIAHKKKCPDLQLVSTGRGRFALRADVSLELVER
jgi:hypothetical protein